MSSRCLNLSIHSFIMSFDFMPKIWVAVFFCYNTHSVVIRTIYIRWTRYTVTFLWLSSFRPHTHDFLKKSSVLLSHVLFFESMFSCYEMVIINSVAHISSTVELSTIFYAVL